MNESDWKVFCKIKQIAIEKYSEKQLISISDILSGDIISSSERLHMIAQLTKSAEKQIASIFDSHSRNSAPLQLMLMRREKLVEPDLLSLLSDELISGTVPPK
ncbi:hypothetical protein [Vibrio diazotrophicus]|uniref:hypothetical protein n=1 Tax=Vibrio diazotrophicus TaxID=685 RepID=UPI00142DF0D9|nr:hypothetical protein [Vibrio diazotrophicus]NIY91117.1 hypothetical protein [Vibrio diazotrophicus]